MNGSFRGQRTRAPDPERTLNSFIGAHEARGLALVACSSSQVDFSGEISNRVGPPAQTLMLASSGGYGLFHQGCPVSHENMQCPHDDYINRAHRCCSRVGNDVCATPVEEQTGLIPAETHPEPRK